MKCVSIESRVSMEGGISIQPVRQVTGAKAIRLIPLFVWVDYDAKILHYFENKISISTTIPKYSPNYQI